jgi:hypothetical protein
MKITFLAGLLSGILGVLAAAHYWPWGEHLRLPSVTSVQPNGGRLEQFVIRLPADRVGGQDVQAPLAERFRDAPAPLEVEHFKVRDSDGTVIGIAARHWAGGDAGATVWSVVLPARGGFVLVGDGGEGAGSVHLALERAGYRAGSAWSGDVSLRPGPAPGGGARVIAGSREFEGIQGEFSEAWRITGVDESGELRGTIELTTITSQHGA